MYDLLIVEDEEIILKALTVIIDWNAIGYSVVGAAGSAIDALRIVEESAVDVVLTDIKMPVISGLELACELKNRFPGIKTILLSAFREFDYAQKAIEYGVYGYLLKTSGKEDIQNFFVKLKHEMDRERSKAPFYSGRDRPGAGLWWADSRQMLRAILTGSDENDPASLLVEAQRLNVNLQHPCFVAAQFDLDDIHEIHWQSGEDGVKATVAFVRNLIYLAVEVRQNGYVTDLDGRICVLLTMKEAQAKAFLRQLLQTVMEELEINQFGRGEEITVSGGVGAAVGSPEQIVASFAMAGELLANRVFLGGGKLLCVEDRACSPGGDDDLSWLKEEADRISALVQECNISAAASELDCMEARLARQCIPSLVGPVQHCLDMLRMAYAQSPGPLVFRGAPINLAQCEKMLSTANTIKGLFGTVRELLYGMEARSQAIHPSSANALVGKALGYLHDHYASDVRLEDVSTFVNVHPVHLCRLFHHETGMTFKELLTRERVGRAKEMLVDPSWKVYEVSLAVGYRKPRYFTDLFKKVTGLTPLEYREKAR